MKSRRPVNSDVGRLPCRSDEHRKNRSNSMHNLEDLFLAGEAPVDIVQLPKTERSVVFRETEVVHECKVSVAMKPPPNKRLQPTPRYDASQTFSCAVD